MAQLENIEAIEKRLWNAADTLRTNSNYASNEYFLPVMGLIFLRHAYSRYLSVKDEIEASLPTRGGKVRSLTKEDFSQKSSIFLQQNAQFDHLVSLTDGDDRARAIIDAMESIEADYESLRGVLPKNEYQDLDNEVLGQLLRTLNPEELKKMSGTRGAWQFQEVLKEQVGTVEEEMPSIIESSDEPSQTNEFEATPPILRSEITSTMKVLTVATEHAKLNGFQMFLALSDRLVKREGEFLRQPHTTKLMWGSHRVIYVFTNATGDLHLYYDIRLKEPLETQTTGGAMFPTTTIVTKDRIYVPVPKVLELAFQITNGTKEFYVRFDTIL